MDRRDYAAMTGGDKAPVLFLEDGSEEELPTKFEVCSLCNGHGSHVNPGIDHNGLDPELAEDPDFMEDYMGGRYDVTCNQCHGKRVSAVVDESRMTKEQVEAWHQQLEDEYSFQQECMAEIRMGA